MLILFLIIPVCIVIAIGLLHLYWAFGGKVFFDYSIPEYQLNHQPQFFKQTPGPMVCLISALFFFCFAALMIGNYFVESSWLFSWVLKSSVVVLLMRTIGEFNCLGLFKRERMTKFARMDNFFAIPICIYLAISVVIQVTVI